MDKNLVEGKIKSYFPFHYKLLRITGLGYFHNPEQMNFNNFPNVWYTVYSLFQLLFSIVLYSELWLEVPNLYNDLDKLMFNLTFSLTFTFTTVKIYNIIRRNRMIQQIIYSIDHDFKDVMQNEKISLETYTRSRRLTFYVLGFANTTTSGLIIGGILQAYFSPTLFYNKHKNEQREFEVSDRILPVPLYIPFEVNSNVMYSIVFIYEVVIISWYGYVVVILNTFTNTILIHFAGKFENLRFILENVTTITLLKMDGTLNTDLEILNEEDIKNIEAYNEKSYLSQGGFERNEYFEKETNALMKKCIQQHVKLLSCVNKFKKAYSLGFLFHVINNLGCVCYIMLQISENEILSLRFVTAISLFITVVSEMLVQCYTANEMTLQALGLAQSAYNCQWYMTDKRFKQSLLILMMRAQKPVTITAGNFVELSNETFVSIMKGAYSFFAFLRSTR